MKLSKATHIFSQRRLKMLEFCSDIELSYMKRRWTIKNKYKSEGYLCDSCESESETNSHILFCPSYALIRQNKDLNSDRDLADYLHRVLEIRSNLRLNR